MERLVISRIGDKLEGFVKSLNGIVIKFNEIFTLGKCRVIFNIPP